MPKKSFSPEQIVTPLRKIEVVMGQGKSTSIACREAGIGLTSFLYQRHRGYCIAVVPSRWDNGGAKVCGAGGR